MIPKTPQAVTHNRPSLLGTIAARTIRAICGILLLGIAGWASYLGGTWLRTTASFHRHAHAGPRLDIHVLDVGDGTCMLLTTPSNHTLLLDAGTRAHPATEVASLLSGRRSVDLILLTSTRPKCIGGFRALMNAIRVNGPVLLAGNTDDFKNGGRAARDVLAVLHERGIQAMPYDEYLLSHPNPLPGESSIQIAGLPVDADSSRDLAMAIRVEYGSSALLYAAGISANEEQDLLSRDGNLACDVLAMPSNGMIHTASPEFLALTGPQVITVSSDRERQPDTQAQRWMFASGAKVGRTDLLGSFTLHMYAAPDQPITWSYTGTPGVAKQSKLLHQSP